MQQHTPIVLTNDDGIDAAGLQALAAALEMALGAAPYVVAPDRCYSGASQQVTMSTPISVEQRGPRTWAVGGSPADCARLAITDLAPGCRLVLAGINHGGNLGHDIYVSGTVGAAREAALLGVNAVAFSHYLRPGVEVDWTGAARWAMQVLESLPLKSGTAAALWNVNFPHLDPPLEAMPPVHHCTPCSRSLPIGYTYREGVYHYDGGRYHTRAQDEGTDVAVCFGGGIAVSPLPTVFSKISLPE